MSKMMIWFMVFSAAFLNGSWVAAQDEPAAYIGSQSQFRDYLNAEMYYPEIARVQNLNADIRVDFLVKASGEVVAAIASGKESDVFGDEAIRLVRRAIWRPGVAWGKAADMKTYVTISFSYKKYQRCVRRRGYDFPTTDSLQADTSIKVYETRQTDAPATALLKIGENLGQYLNKNLHYPEAARKQSISGRVKVRFVIEPAGYAAHYIVEEGVNGGCTEEALRLISEMHWKPAMKNGIAVRSWYFMSFGFGANGSDFQYFPTNQGGGSMN
ncbi:MAG TPA: hypothetical protein DCR43_07810 [Bacteroidales bacterium]|nr:MAG: hypothetical protein A2X11_14415 [Bacteroidetes bacterium GWE2_42_24]OFY31549.1 MAG: hypothetical protein A2X09_08155 [Bacteroidetes bacterium GWF2_43_11]HAQ65738.1 hypothetical protein [Bacteroidales bacterium]HBZ67201.1 hypothetical protein [Bacteroidales bacterium]